MDKPISAAALPGVNAGGEFAAGTVPPPADPSPVAPPAADPSATPPEWVGRIKDEGLRTKVLTKGFRDEEALAKSYFEAESLLGHDRAGRTVVLPKDDADVEGREALFTKLGRPEKPDGYGVVPLDGQDPAWVSSATETMHKAGLSTQQAHALVTWFNEAETARQQADVDAFVARVEPELATLRQEWGDADTIAANEESIRRAMASKRGTVQQREAAEFYLGTKRFLQAMLEDGIRMREDQGPRGASSGAPLTVPNDRAAALAQMDRLTNDAVFMAKWMNKEPEAVAHMIALQKAAAQNPA